MQWYIDIFDCVNKKSLVKDPLYDYIINTNQDYGTEEKKKAIEAYEESSNGFCPKDCSICTEQKKCLKTRKQCYKIDINCAECSDDNQFCTKCSNNLYLYQNKCYEKKKSVLTKYNKLKFCNKTITGCSTCITEDVCIECNFGYGLEYETRKCKTIKSMLKTYYYDYQDKTYKKCHYGVNNCLYCSNSNFCYRCQKGFYLIEYEKDVWDYSRCYKLRDLPDRSVYYDKNSTHKPLCSSKIPGCNTCNTIGSRCLQCLSGYKLFKNKTHKYCVESGLVSKYHHCQKFNSTHCIECRKGYTNQIKERYGKCFPTPQDNEYYYDDKEKAYIKCLNSSYLERCLKCNNSHTCIECDTKAHVLKDGKCIRISN